jgi:hypothetical protein
MKKVLIRRIKLLFLLLGLGLLSNAQKEPDGIKLTDFKIEKQLNGVNVMWAVQNASAVNYFELERSIDGKEYKTVAIIFGPDPEKDDKSFDCLDKQKKMSNYYRINHIDTEGNVNFTVTKMIKK